METGPPLEDAPKLALLASSQYSKKTFEYQEIPENQRSAVSQLTTGIHEKNSWRMSTDTLDEFLKFVGDVSHIQPHRLSETELDSVQGDTYAGTNMFLLTLACYTTGDASEILHYSPEKGVIRINENILTTTIKEPSRQYADKYIEKDGKPSELYRTHATSRFRRVLEDNGSEIIDMPDFMLQPVLLGLRKHDSSFSSVSFPDNPLKNFEGACYRPRPNISTLESVASLCQTPTENFKDAYPILSDCFGPKSS